jgi:hypothetical protein
MIEYGEMLEKIKAGKGVEKAIGDDSREGLKDLKKKLFQKN